MGTADARVAGGPGSLAPLRPASRWVRLLAGVVLMMAVASLVFAWPLLRSAPGQALAGALAAAENAFAAFIVAETVFVPLEAWLGARIPRWWLVAAGGALALAGGLLSGGASPRAQVAWSVLGGAGAGFVYGGTVAKVLGEFTDRKALCVGVTAGACSAVLALAGAAVWALSSARALPLLVVVGGAQAAVIVLATLFILQPPPDRPPPDW